MTYELRTYNAAPGRMTDLVARFKDHSVWLFEQHGMTSLGYWVAQDDDEVLVYLLRHRGDPDANWNALRADARWTQARAESEHNGALTLSVRSQRLDAADIPFPGAARVTGAESC
ncbi:NIPSNAP family protein [Microbacterium sp. zg.B48]|uniref:NIPSNAP family protein n=1 Tax=Microbacterium sp. zg.B48 TaxID=2969408 RepID=UPI00214B8B6E|nr:NIPSNAP family protein [Microbacterium sp. zg.B48]MCR2764360.1 NIPSNAP family protein [Microbacterium sp. zg.B48]